MPASDWDYFVLLCTDVELGQQLGICRNSEFRVEEDSATGGFVVYDRKTAILRAEPGVLGWLVWLHRKYYRHPLGPPGDGNSPPCVP